MALVKAFRECVDRRVNKFKAGRGLNCTKNRQLLPGGKVGATISTLVSNPIFWISDPNFWILKVSQRLLSTEKPLWSVIPFSTPLTTFVDLIKVYRYQQLT